MTTYSSGITETLQNVILIARIFDEQIKHKRVFSLIAMLAPRLINDFASFHGYVIDRGTNDPTVKSSLMRIQKRAKANVEIYDNYLNDLTKENKNRETARIRIRDPFEIWWVNSSGAAEFDEEPGHQVYTNRDLAFYCAALIDFLQDINGPPQNKTKSNEPGLKIKALKAVYENQIITRADGDKLYQHFAHYSRRENRIGGVDPEKKRECKAKRNLFERVIIELDGDAKKRAEDEYKMLIFNM